MTDKYPAHEEDFTDDFGGDDEVDKQIDKQIAAHNEKVMNSQHSSNSEQPAQNRVLSAKAQSKNEVEPELHSHPLQSESEAATNENYGTTKEEFYSRFTSYVRQNQITPEQFSQSKKTRISSDEFKDLFEYIGFGFSKEEFEDVVYDVTDGNFNVILKDFRAKIPDWEKNSTEKTLELLKNKTLKLAQNSQKKLEKPAHSQSQRNFIVRPQSSMMRSPQGLASAASARPFSGVSGISGKSKQTLGTTQNDFKMMNSSSTDNFRPSTLQNRSTHYLQERKKREIEKDQSILFTLDKARTEFELDCLEKMNEANELYQQMGEPITCKAYTGYDGHAKCHIYEYDRLVAELSMKDFVREYKALKRRCTQTQGLPFWETLMKQKVTSSNFYFSSAKSLAGGTNQVIEPLDSKRGGKKDRQKELKAVLYETMKLSLSLQAQLGKLQKAGFGPEYQTSKY